jgi:SnoaL-like domain
MAELVEAGTAETILGLQRLVTRSIECIDAGDRAAFAAAWWDDSVWNLGAPFPEFVGIDAIRQAGEDVLWSVWSLTHHVVGSADIALTGAGTATGCSRVIAVVVRAEDRLMHVVGARYDDAFTCHDGEWRIARRDVLTSFLAPMPGIEALPLQALGP